MSYRGFIDLILDMAHLDPLKFEAFKRIDSALTELYRNVEGISVAPQSTVVTPITSGHWQRVGLSLIPLNAGDDVELQGNAKLLMYNGVYTPQPNVASGFAVVSVGSVINPAVGGGSNEGFRRGLVNIIDLNETDADTVALQIDVRQTSNPGAGLIARTGLHIKHYGLPDNGGDSSAALIVTTGGGNGLAVYQVHERRPTGTTDYAVVTTQGAMEIGTTGGSHGLLAIGGPQTWGVHTRASDAIWVRLDNGAAKGIVVTPSQDGGAFDVFDDRIAYSIGSKLINSANTNIKFYIKLNSLAHFSNNVGIGVEPTAASGLLLHLRKASADATLQVNRITTNPSTIVISAQADVGIIGTSSNDPIQFITNNTARLLIAATGEIQGMGGTVATQNAVLATTATAGHLGIPVCAGVPTGVPGAVAGNAFVVFDTTNNKIMVYNGGWKGVVVA